MYQPVELDVSDVSKAFAILGFFIVVYGQISYIVKERLYLSEPLIAVTLGIIVGPYVLGWLDPLSWSDQEINRETTYQFTRLVVGIQVLFTGISLPKAYLRREIISLTVLLFGIMTTAWFVTALLIWGLIRLPASLAPDGIGYSLTFLEALCIAAAVTPTDPVLANSITKGRYAEKHVPANVRNIILAESGANDGLGFPFLYLAIYLINRSSVDAGLSVGSEVGRWVYGVVIYQILLSVVYGALLGYIARKTLRWAESRKYIDKDSFFAFGLGLALFTLGTTGLFGSDDILACFVAGNSFTWDDWFRIRSEESDIQDILDMLLNAAVFIYIGAIIPWGFYHTDGGIEAWRIVVLGITVLLLRRPPWVIASMKIIPALSTWGEAAFAGFFGPIGVGAVFYIEVALRKIPDDGSRDLLRNLYTPVVLFCVFSSVLVHGVTVPISKLGPNIVRKSATLTKTRSITLTSKHTPRSSDEAGRGGGSGEKELWNPLYSLWQGLLSVALFWRRDSFWRRDAESRSKTHAHISEPSNAVRRASIEEEGRSEGGGAELNQSDSVGTEQSNASGSGSGSSGEGPRGARPVPSALELPTSHAHTGNANVNTSANNNHSSPIQPPAQASSASTEHQQTRKQAKPYSSLLHDLQMMLDKEMSAERSEAREEAGAGWPEEVRRALEKAKLEQEAREAEGTGVGGSAVKQQQQQHQGAQGMAAPDSMPGTPSRVRFHGR
ncbi:hypothetical protein BCV69DRAFT_281530 [Microstroma glucosiphilum]|uniref:Cation/H+ exchanger transmembrane domain-containing protein n=1 Tax=Pseudomicrostroma glucosiphilum TaxID=1684307 RepID=A0A316UCG7_9BASI|nr:hypothetical protein BCV69DRAFT_281530 [Pseudomicrostroma glucosiphilum]PWN22554.1 hypothetical protein BCV69DRAFT_281530 [Pseudomicrostroma glucosiphilum]